MNYETAIAEVQQIAGWRSDKAAEIGRALQYAQTEREKPGKTYPWFLRQTKTITTVAGTPSYNLPTGYIQDTEERDGNVFIYSNQSLGPESRTIFLRKLSWKDAQEKYFGVWPQSGVDTLSDQSATVQPGVPRDYVLQESTVYFYPTPDAAYTVNWRCWAADATLGAGVENRWLLNAPWVLIGDAARKICSDLGYADGLSRAQGILQIAEQNLFIATIHREEAGRKRSMGSRL